MKNALKCFGGKCNASGSASVVDGKLILSCPHALTPVVWQMDLSEVKASAMEIRDSGDKGFVLALKTLRGETVDIASFKDRGEAIETLMATARAMEKAHGQIRLFPAGGSQQQATVTHMREPRRGKWAGILIGFALIALLLYIWGALLPRPSGTVPASIGTANAPTSFKQNNQETGVPLSADEFLLQK